MFFLAAFPGVVEAVALAVGLQDVDTVGQPVEQGPGHPLVAQDFGPLLEGQVAGEDEALALLGALHGGIMGANQCIPPIWVA